MIKIFLLLFRKYVYGREAIDRRNRKRLVNKDFSIISSNCNGAFISHDLGIRFNSPFVNLWIEPKDFLKLCKDIKGYLDLPLCFTDVDGIGYPVGQLGDIKIYFQHYDTEENALVKWNERKNRINWDSIYLVFSDRDGCTYEDMLSFDKLNYKKVVFTKQQYNEIKSSFYIPGFEKEASVGILSDYKNKWFGIRYLDRFDYVEWLNR